METVTMNVINRNLKYIMKEIAEIREHMVDVDTILTPEEEEGLERSIKNYKLGKTKDFDKLKEELGL